MSHNILCMGGINMDLVMFVPHLPAPGETVVTDNFSTFPGGKGGNQAVTAAMLGGDVRYFGKLGGDGFSDELIESLRVKGIQTDTILRDEDATAGIAMIWVDKKGQNSISFNPGANAKLTAEEVPQYAQHFTQDSILLITGEIFVDTIYAAIRQAHERGMFVIFDPAPVPAQPFPEDIPGCVDILKPNESEATYITGVQVTDFDSAEEALYKLHEMGFACPVVTLGEQGAVAWVDGTAQRIDPVVVEVVDSTAAGDVFSGALAAWLAQGHSFEEALDFARTAAALSTTVQGAQTSIPTLEHVQARM